MQPSVYEPSMAGVLQLPTHILVVRVGGMAALAVGGSIAMRWSVRWYEIRSKVFLPGTHRHPRCGPSIWLNMWVTGGAAVALQAAYRSVRFLPMAVDAIVKGLRVCAGMEASAPYGEMTGGSAVKDVAAALDTVCRAVRIPYVPQLSIFGINPKPMTVVEYAELFSSGNEGTQRFHTPARFLSMAVVGVAAFGMSRVIRNALLVRLAPGIVPPRPKWNMCALLLAAPAAVYQVLAVAGDDEAVCGVPTPTLFVGLFAANAYAINAFMASRHPKLPPSQADTDLDARLTKFLSALQLRYIYESDMYAIIQQLFLVCVRNDSTIGTAGTIAISALSRRLGTEAGLTVQLSEYGITNVCIWKVGMEGCPLGGTCRVCGQSLVLSATEIAEVPCCKQFTHALCLLASLKSRSSCPDCKAPHRRHIPQDVQRLISTFSSLGMEEKGDFLQNFAIYEKTTIGVLFGFICHSSSNTSLSRLPYAAITVEEIVESIVSHPAPSRIVNEAGTTISVLLASPLSMQVAYLLSIVVCPTGVEDPLFPPSLSRFSKAKGLYETSPTHLGKVIAAVGSLLNLHFDIFAKQQEK